MNNEKMLIGQILTDNKIFHSLQITEDDIYNIDYRRIFRAITDCINKGIVADIITVSNDNRNISPVLLSTITSDVISTVNWEYYQSRILKNSYKEKVKRLSRQFTDWVNTESPKEAIRDLEEALMLITKNKNNNRVMKLNEVSKDFIDLIEKRYHAKGEMPGIPSGISKLDSMILGFRKRMFYLIGGRPSQGKSALLLNMACNAAIDNNIKVGYISTESSVMEIVTRLYSSQGKVNSMNLITGMFTHVDFSNINSVVENTQKTNMYFYYTPGMTLDDVSQTARLMVRYYGCQIIYVDYLQDITIDGNETTLDKTKRKSKAMKYLAEELDIPIVVGAQLRRDADERRPRLSDFSDSSQLEKDADGAILIYHHHTNKKETTENGANPEYESYLLAEKVRDGMTGSIPIYFKKEYVTFTERIVYE